MLSHLMASKEQLERIQLMVAMLVVQLAVGQCA
jgi:hypothetical protein